MYIITLKSMKTNKCSLQFTKIAEHQRGDNCQNGTRVDKIGEDLGG